MKGNPFEEFESLLQRMEQGFEGGMDLQTRTGSTAVDVADRDEEFVVTVDLPGYETEDIDLTLADDTLRLEAEREIESEDETDHYLRRERRRQSVSRSIPFPESVDAESVTASHTNGVLTVTVPKEFDSDEGHSIDIE
ncbi:Hsp20/alpha crystallin family protein [Natranaeroarchaeum sulfidigenes]|uniref:Molecular chaperone (HSP20 family) n=1 Tax=Natranaeroarchaeum sulfidigenes TaxID=2784880 RepID=A0A897MNN0_9EURY|nr:Hsp20/alpha crystallin family protein [Natranaeroarchaeum sulfidigenes]QSG01538.1 Molecular chaperone (HSP20 family) [Natranaeroarchaeum sulfidigenes]